MIAGQIPIRIVIGIVLSQQRCNLLTQDAVQLCRRYIFVASHTLFDALDNLQRRVNADIGCDKNFFQIVKHIVVNLGFSCHRTCQFLEH